MTQLMSGAGVAAGPPEPSPDLGRRTVAIASLTVLATFLDTTVLFVASGDIAASFPSVGPAELSWVATSALSAGVRRTVIAPEGDRALGSVAGPTVSPAGESPVAPPAVGR